MSRRTKTGKWVPPNTGADFGGYHTLMRHRVEQILLVASPYDCFILEEDGRFSDRIYAEYLELNLANSPRFDRVSTARDALAKLRRQQYELVITTPHCAGMSPAALATAVKRRHPDLQVAMLTVDRLAAEQVADLIERSDFDQLYTWTGDPRLLLAMVKLEEDRLNVKRDTRKGSVRVLLLVEDSPVFYSSYLPILYTEVYEQTRSLMGEVVNEAHRMYRMRARPKVLLARTYEEGRAVVRQYQDHLLGVVMDMQFPRKGVLDPRAGVALQKLIRKRLPDIPVLFQSAQPEARAIAEDLGAAFADKNSPELMEDLRRFMTHDLGFGPFVFRTPAGAEIERAEDIPELLRALDRVPRESFEYHGIRQHFSNWFMARSEFLLASEVRSRSVSEFGTLEEARAYLQSVVAVFLQERQQGQVTDYVRGTDPLAQDFSRIDAGSMGGKARGIAFLSSQLAHHPIHERFPDVRIFAPRTKVICTDAFDRFCRRNGLRDRALEAENDEEVARLFLEQPLEDELLGDLAAILAEVRYPLAVRSSSLYEDSSTLPLAGLYKTVLVPNCADSDARRLEHLSRAIRLVYASAFFHGPRSYLEAGGVRHDEEKMAVAIQRIVGSRHGDRFYPDFAGTAQSRNYYPVRYLKPEDGVVTVALGLGKTVVEGGKAYRFCPLHPEVVPEMSTPADALRFSQRAFYALDMARSDPPLESLNEGTIGRFGLAEAEEDGTLMAVGATYVADEDRVMDSVYLPGVRLVNFAQVLKYDRFPLAPILSELLEIGSEGMGAAVELEFAVALEGIRGRPELAVLQIRPQVSQPLVDEVDGRSLAQDELPLFSGSAIGNGIFRDIQDIVYVHPDRFDASATRAMAHRVGVVDFGLRQEGRPYVLVGPGRWGSADPWLGIPVRWPQVSGARVIVELAVPDYRLQPSQGSHFFHNLVAAGTGYFYIDVSRGDQFLDLAWLESLDGDSEEAGVRHVTLDQPIEVRLDGRTGEGMAVRKRD